MSEVPPATTGRAKRLRPLADAALIGTGTVAGVYVLWQIREALLLAFAGVIVAVALLAGTAPLERRVHMPHTVALLIVSLLLLALLAGSLWLVGGQIGAQAADLAQQVPAALRHLEQRFGFSLSDMTSDQGSLANLTSAASRFFGSVWLVGGSMLAALSASVLVVIGGFFFAGSPDLYRSGLVMLFPRDQQASVDEALLMAAEALRKWLLAQLLAMAVIGLASGLASWWLGLRAPAAIGLFAGLMEFVPMLGPFLGALPAVLLAASIGWDKVLWTIAAFTLIQQFESNLLMPIIQRGLVEIPPGLLLFAVLAVGLLFGMLGVLVAAPITVVVYVLVKRLYVVGTLGQQTHLPEVTHESS